MILPGVDGAFFFRYSSFRLALLLIVDGLGFFFFFFIFFSAFCLLEASSLVSREKLKEPTFSAKLNDRLDGGGLKSLSAPPLRTPLRGAYKHFLEQSFPLVRVDI